MPKAAHLHVEPLTAAVGGIVHGADLARPQSAAEVAFIRAALLDRGVIFFRDQSITTAQHWDFDRQFGVPMSEESSGSPEDTADKVMHADLAPTRHATAVWHADTTSLARPPWGTTLRAVTLPEVGGDTCWASAQAAFEALSPRWQAMLDGLSAVHAVEPLMVRMKDFGPVFRERFVARHDPSQVHPVVLVHPETGRKGLFVNEAFTTRILELEPAESDAVLAVLFRHLGSPDFMVRWRWRLGDLAFWDNRSVQHYAVPDYAKGRVMERIVLDGVRPGSAETARIAAEAAA
jgi:alpha-ketoglutarate-dependent taurine dioxygenase